jgi:hypothetical protein
MLVSYSLKIRSIHSKYLSLGVLALLDLLKKKEQIAFIDVRWKKTKKKIHRYTLLKSPFVNKKAREQFKLQLHTLVVFFSVRLSSSPLFYLDEFVSSILRKYLSSQYFEAGLAKRYTLPRGLLGSQREQNPPHISLSLVTDNLGGFIFN